MVVIQYVVVSMYVVKILLLMVVEEIVLPTKLGHLVAVREHSRYVVANMYAVVMEVTVVIALVFVLAIILVVS